MKLVRILKPRLPRIIKLLLRPFYRALVRRLELRRRRRMESESEQRQRMLGSSYGTFCQLSQKDNIDNVLFANGKAILTLKDGRRYYFDATDRVARMYSVPETGTFEAKETDFVRGLVRPGQVCFDVGASFGWYTILLSKLVGPAGHVHAFEPIPHNFDVLQSNVTLNECSNVTLNEVALDATNGQKDLFLPDIGVSGSLRLYQYKKTYQVINCRTRTLDEYCLEKGISHVDFIKADIEGAELLMLKGAIETLRQSKPVLMLESQSNITRSFGYEPAELFTWLAGLDYVPHFVADTGSPVRLTDYRGRLPDYNFIFLPQGDA